MEWKVVEFWSVGVVQYVIGCAKADQDPGDHRDVTSVEDHMEETESFF